MHLTADPEVTKAGFKFNFFISLLKLASHIIFYLLNLSANLLFMPCHQKVAGYYVKPSEILSVRPSIRQRPHHSSARNSSYSFRPILFKLYRHFYDGLKIGILFFQNPEIIFYYIFCIFNLRLFSSPNTTEMYREYVPSARNSSYSFRPILFKLYRRF